MLDVTNPKRRQSPPSPHCGTVWHVSTVVRVPVDFGKYVVPSCAIIPASEPVLTALAVVIVQLASGSADGDHRGGIG